MMGLPAGHVTGHGLRPAQELKMLGNGVVPQQAALALRMLLGLGGDAVAVGAAGELLPTPVRADGIRPYSSPRAIAKHGAMTLHEALIGRKGDTP
jgi:DNA (cytosine-5)-methyltransferase 1